MTKLEKRYIHLLLYRMIKIVYKSIIVPLPASKSKGVIDQIGKGESYKIDQASDEGKDVIRHTGGWAVHAVIAELNLNI